jgi:hypothetical protein
MPLVRLNAMAWTDETEEEGVQLKVLVTRSDPVAGRPVVTEEQAIPRAPQTVTAADRREALHGAQMVLEAVAAAGDAARSDAQESPGHEGSGARRQAPVQEG